MKHLSQINGSIIGIDVSKNKLDVHILPQKKALTLSNNTQEISAFIKEIKQTYQTKIIVMESTGGYEKLPKKLFDKASLPVHVAHPMRVHYFAKQKGFFAKTDKIDALSIALYGLQENVLPTKESDNELLKYLSSRHGQLIDQLTREKNRLKDFLPNKIQKSIKRVIKSLEKELDVIEKAIAEEIESSQEMALKSKRLQTFKGIGKRTAHVLIAELPELGCITRKEASCLCGLAPRNNDSGTKVGRRSISGGRFHVRKALYMASLSAIRHNPAMQEYYQTLKAKGKHSKVALVAVMRKMIIALNAMLRDQKDWQLVFDKGIKAAA